MYAKSIDAGSGIDALNFGSSRISGAFIGSVSAETVAANPGIGYMMMAASGSFNVPLVFAGLIMIATMGIVMYQIFALIERRIAFWALCSQEVVT